jgi:hypothetical protein
LGPKNNGRSGIGREIPVGFLSPTQAEPGSAEKVEILRLRYAAGCTIFHPEDRRIEHWLYNRKTYILSLKEICEAAERIDAD